MPLLPDRRDGKSRHPGEQGRRRRPAAKIAPATAEHRDAGWRFEPPTSGVRPTLGSYKISMKQQAGFTETGTGTRTDDAASLCRSRS